MVAIGCLDTSKKKHSMIVTISIKKKQCKWKIWCWYQIGGTVHFIFIGYRVEQSALDQSEKPPKGVYSAAGLGLAHKWMMFISRKGLLWYLPNKVPAHWICEIIKHFSFTSTLFYRINSSLIASTTKTCKINVAESFFWYCFKNRRIHLSELKTIFLIQEHTNKRKKKYSTEKLRDITLE